MKLKICLFILLVILLTIISRKIYLENFNNKKELKFIHVTKTAGTSIEDEALEHNILWGRFHKKEYGWWHKPFKYLPKKLKKKYDWFMVVRNPYERVVSEFYWWARQHDTKNVNNKKIWNKINRLLLEKKYNHDLLKNTMKDHGYLVDHWNPQHLYYEKHNDYKITVLKFENLNQEFENLMIKYNLPVRLNKNSMKSPNKIFGVKDLDRETIDIINRIYEKDFELFGYEKL